MEDTVPTTIESYTYDTCGNTLTTNLNRYYVWNHANQLLSYYNSAGGTPTVFTQYDYAGQDRVSKLVRTGTNYERTVYIDGIFEYVILETPGTTYEKNYIHIMDDQTRIAEFRINPGAPFPGDISDNEVFILQDQIGSSVARLSTSGIIIDEEEYYPFGDSSLRTFTYKRYRYVGKEKDGESGLYYYGARYYAAWVGRFVSVDPLADRYAQLSPYNYASNNPVTHIDVDGRQNPQQAQTPTGQPENKVNNKSGKQNVTLKINDSNVQPAVRDNTYSNNIAPDQKTLQTFKDKADGTYEAKQQRKAFEAIQQQSKENQSKATIAPNYENPDAENVANAKKAYDETDSKVEKLSILFNIFGVPIITAAGVLTPVKEHQPKPVPYTQAGFVPGSRFNINDPKTFEGASLSEVHDWLIRNGYSLDRNSNSGGGEVYNNGNLGEQIRLMPGYPSGSRSERITEGPYMVISNGPGSPGDKQKVALFGNPTLN